MIGKCLIDPGVALVGERNPISSGVKHGSLTAVRDLHCTGIPMCMCLRTIPNVSMRFGADSFQRFGRKVTHVAYY